VKETTLAKRDSIFITGTFNNWDSLANRNYKLEPYGNGEWSILLSLPAGDHSYKYSGGNWWKVEKFLNGDEAPDRKINCCSAKRYKPFEYPGQYRSNFCVQFGLV
jgi:hypothetical protein